MGSVKPYVKLDQKIAELIQVAVESTLRDMFDIPVQCESALTGMEPFAKEPCVASTLDMIEAGQLHGVFIVAFSPGAIDRVLAVCGVDQGSDPAAAHDAIEEVTNVMFGAVKKSLNEMGHSFTLGLPHTIVDKPLFFEEQRGNERLVLPFFADGHSCHAAILIKN